MTHQRLLFSAQHAATALAERASAVVANSRSERGSAMSEYGLLIGMIFITALIGLAVFGEAVLELFTGVNNEYENNAPTN